MRVYNPWLCMYENIEDTGEEIKPTKVKGGIFEEPCTHCGSHDCNWLMHTDEEDL